MTRSSANIVTTLALVVLLVVGVAACGGSDESSAKTDGGTTTTAALEFPFSGAGGHAACITSARAIESAAAINYAKTGSYGTIDDLVTAGYLRNAPDPSWGLTIGPDGTVDDSTCP